MGDVIKNDDDADPPRDPKRRPFQVRLPGFVGTEPTGLGQVLKGITSSIGIRPCGGCERRAATLDRWVEFRGR